ncbi:hypothetical protein OC25_02255 [Pedobacter kyungheensis]|uniref:Response regulatory domain-containing protein n=1 Tax=Pedobacter kyungheensis TaxID=1069985 RepID=A0A0C1FUJ2_9SPHI|nr:response regulator [Pedobacter kyungheensis]KIA96582.1 hypothetical protein OC25_02255 [Pedobacter kyungheensis]
MNKTILVIDDDEDILNIMELILQDAGYTPCISQKGLSPQSVAEINPALVITDVRISGFEKTGAELCSDYKSNPRTMNIPILLISAELELGKLADHSGANGFITKPFDIAHVLDQVKQYC